LQFQSAKADFAFTSRVFQCPVNFRVDFFSYVLIAIWLVGLWLLGWLVLPLTRRLFRNLPDGGLAAGRMLAIVLFSLLTMWLGVLHIAPLTLVPLWFVGLPVLCAVLTWRNTERRREFFDFVRSHRQALIFSDALFVLAFAFFVWVRACHPHLNEFEKPMDSAIMGSISRTQFLPADNPWLSGVPFTNYYYFGHLMGANLARLFATPIALAYNLIVPAFCAFFISTLWSLCAALSGGLWRGTVAMSMVALLGNFAPLRQRGPAGQWQPWPVDWWASSRVIDTAEDHTINEYPLFTQALGDAHAHFFALPLAALVLCTCWALFVPRRSPDKARFLTPRLSLLLLIGTLLGAMVMTNTWDVPTYAGVAMLCAVLTADKANQWVRTGWSLLPFQLTLFMAVPYLYTFKPQVSGVNFEWWTPPAYPFWLLWCGFTMLWCVVLAVALFRPGSLLATRHRNLQFALQLSLCIFLLCWLSLAVKFQLPEAKTIHVWFVIFTLLLPTTCLALLPWLTSTAEVDAQSVAEYNDKSQLVWVLGLFGMLALLAPMLFYVNGAFAGAHLHQDTVFKYVLQAWLLLGTAAGCGVLAWWSTLRTGPRLAVRFALMAACSIPAICSAGVIHSRTIQSAQRDEQGKIQLSLDGARYLPPDDRKAIAWLATNARPGETVLEAVGEKGYYSYNEFGRVASLSGVPTPLGWTQHVGLFWGGGDEVFPRWEKIRSVYTWPNDGVALDALRKLGVRYVFVGEVERNGVGLPPLQRMRKALPVVFESGETVILAVPAG